MNSENSTNNREQDEEIMAENNEEIVNPEGAEEQETQTQPGEGQEDTAKEINPAAKLENELKEAKDKYLRLYSEFENFRRRTAKEKIDMVQNANEKLITSLLPVLDDLDRAEKNLEGNKDAAAQLEGFTLIHNKFRKIVEQQGVKVLALEPGADFDTDTQEAITQIPAPDEKLKGKVVDVIEKGYTLNDKVIRYAKVVVGN